LVGFPETKNGPVLEHCQCL